MWLFKCVRTNDKNGSENKRSVDDIVNEEDKKIEERVDHVEEERHIDDEVQLVYFACTKPNQDVMKTLTSLTGAAVQTFTSEKECVKYITAIINKVFLIIDDSPPSTLLELIEPLKQIDSLFIYSSSTSDSIFVVNQKQHAYLVNWCEHTEALIHSIKRSCKELDKQTAAFSMYNKKEKATRDLSRERVSFLFFQLFKNLLKNIPKTADAKKIMVTTCRNYYRGNSIELANIDEFNRTYRSLDAISWYVKDTFIQKFINKALRTENIDVLYQFRFYILDLSEQLEHKCLELRRKQTDVLKLYQTLKLNSDEIENYQKNIGKLFSPNGYLSGSSQRSVAYDFALKSAKHEGLVRALIEYQVDLQAVQTIVIADIRQYSGFPEKAEFLFDIGAVFQIDDCQYNAEEDLWYIQVHATDQGAVLNVEYMEYQKKKMAQSNIALMFGNLLVEMGEYDKAERYFDTILSSSNPNDEEIACIFFNFGRVHRLKGDFNRAINCYNRAYHLHMNARPKRSASAGKALNGLGIVYSEQGKEIKAEECFLRAKELYKTSIPKYHVDVAGILINLGTIDCNRQDYRRASLKFLEAKKIYERSLPFDHPNQALTRVNLGNIYLLTGNYEKALKEYESALKIQESSLPGDHPDLTRTLHNLAVVQTRRGNMKQAKEYLERAEQITGQTLSSKHPLTTLLDKTKNLLVEGI